MKNKDLKILQDIVDLEGDCLDHNRCDKCPLRKKCLPVFLHKRRPSKNKRMRVALDTIANVMLMGDDHEPSLKEEL